jgi:hypothetical protein
MYHVIPFSSGGEWGLVIGLMKLFFALDKSCEDDSVPLLVDLIFL